MDNYSDESSANTKHVYKMHGNAFPLDCLNLSNNNNNNENMDDANQLSTAQKFATMRQDSINSDYSPLTDSTQTNADERCMDFRADDECSVNDNETNASDEASDDSSGDNLSFVGDDIVENVILLPGNFLSDDESTNSDDVVYAYRGAGFDPDPLNDDENADEETDYLEMDFEPDPASEIEPEVNEAIEPSHLATVGPSFKAPKSYNAVPAQANDTESDMERTGVHKNWLAPVEVLMNGIYKEPRNLDDTSPSTAHPSLSGKSSEEASMHAKNNNKLEATTDPQNESNKSLAIKGDETQSANNAQPVYYDNTVSLSNKKYTGTIPKISKLHMKSSRSRTSTGDLTANANGTSRHEHALTDAWHQTNERWKSSERDKTVSSIHCDSLTDLTDSVINVAEYSYAKSTAMPTTRSMSFPNEHLSDHSIREPHIFAGEPAGKREMENDVDQPVSVEFDSTYCTIDTIIKALEKMHVLPNVRILQNLLSGDESAVARMNIPEYLVYASKRHCNYKAIVTAIQQACDDVDIKFYMAPNGLPETVNIPFQMIAARLPTNGSLSNILKIKNNRFHQMNVLGKIVTVIRKYPNMTDNLIRNEYISIPQYYRSGVICIRKKKPSE